LGKGNDGTMKKWNDGKMESWVISDFGFENSDYRLPITDYRIPAPTASENPALVQTFPEVVVKVKLICDSDFHLFKLFRLNGKSRETDVIRMCELIISVGVSLNMLISYVISGDKNSKL
jgi:hypothetical protein